MKRFIIQATILYIMCTYKKNERKSERISMCVSEEMKNTQASTD